MTRFETFVDAAFAFAVTLLVVGGGLTAAGPEISKRFPKSLGRTPLLVGITKGATGEPPVIQRLDDR